GGSWHRAPPRHPSRTLFRSEVRRAHADQGQHRPLCLPAASRYAAGMDAYVLEAMREEAVLLRLGDQVAADTTRAVHALAKRLRADRKSPRLNSSHVNTSYAV